MIKFNKNLYFYDRVVNYVNRNWNFKDNNKYFESIKEKKIYNAVHNFSTPSFEYGALKVVEKVFPSTKDKKFSTNTLRQRDVLESDISELKIYKSRKPFKVSNLKILNKVYKYIENKIISKDIKITMFDAIDTLPKNTSSGFPDYTKKKNIKTIKKTESRIKKVLSMDDYFDIYKYIRKFPTTIFHRFTPKMKLVNNTYNPNFKIRQIFGTPFFIVALEKFIFYNFIESYKSAFNEQYMVGKKKIDISKKIGQLRINAIKNNKIFLCGDISGCDKSISKTHSLIYFQLAYNLINKNYTNIFIALLLYYLRTPILFSKGLTYSNGSTISGSWITSSFTSLCIQISVLYSFYSIYNRFPRNDEYLFLGDDFIILIDKEFDKFKFKEYMLEFNLRLRLDKSEIATPYQDVEFLGYFWDSYNSPEQSDDWIISRILYPEKFVKFDGKYRVLYRILSIIINLKRYRILYNRLYNYDKYLRDYINSDNKLFTLFDSNNNIINVRIPIELFWTKGWRVL